MLRFSVGRLAVIEVPLTRPVGAVDWSTDPPRLTQVEATAELVCAPAAAPHRFAAADAIVPLARGAAGYALRFTDGRIADPMHLLASSQFNLGDFEARFSDDLGSRQFRDGGRGSGELARARIAWSRAECASLQALAAKSRVVRQFEDPLVYNLCGRDWCDREHAERAARSDPHEALYLVALEQGLASLPEGASERYAHVGIAEMAEDLAAWTRTFALPRGQLSADAAAAALQLWLSPAACDGADALIRVLINDPFVARATRYAAIRMHTTAGGAVG